MERIKILHFIPGFLYGGVESLFMMWSEKIDHSKFEFELLLRTNEPEIELLNEYADRGGRYYRLEPFSPKHLFRYIKSVRSFFREHHDYHIMHAHGGDPFVLFYAKRYGIKCIIYHSHSSSYGESRYKFAKRVLNSYYNGYISQRMACSDFAAQWLFPDRADVVQIPNSVDIDRFKFNPDIRKQTRASLGLQEKLVIISVGRLTHQKNYPFIVDIFFHLSQVRDDAALVIVGDGPDKERIEGAIRERGLSERVSMMGRRNDVQNLLQMADLFLMPSHYEGLPVTIVEAQTSGLPSLLSDSITKQVQITNLVEYLSLNDSAKKWSDKIIDMVDRERDRSEYYYEVAKTDFNIDNSINKLSNCYIRCKENENIIS